MNKTFININLTAQPKLIFVLRHIVYSGVWIILLSVLFFRVDTFVYSQDTTLTVIIPVILIMAIVAISIWEKWYYTILFFVYPIFFLVCFLPKQILKIGKFYLLLEYTNFFIRWVKNFRIKFITLTILFVSSVCLITFDHDFFRYVALICWTTHFINYTARYVKTMFKPIQIFGVDFDKILEFIENGGKKSKSVLIDIIVSTARKVKNDDENNRELIRREKTLQSLTILSYSLGYFNQRLKGYKGQKAYMLSWLYGFLKFAFLVVIFFSFCNYQLFKIDPSNYLVTPTVNYFDFLYYTLKNIVFNNTESIAPNSVIAKLIEIFTFIFTTIFILTILISFLFALNHKKFEENVVATTGMCLQQQILVNEYIMNEYGKDIETLVNEFESVKQSIKNIKGVFDKLF